MAHVLLYGRVWPGLCPYDGYSPVYVPMTAIARITAYTTKGYQRTVFTALRARH